MKKVCAVLLSTTLVHSPLTVSAQDTEATTRQETAGFGIGALIGGLIAGPPGAVIGAAGGTLFGHHTASKDNAIAALETQLQDKSIELAYLQDELARTQTRYAMNLQQVALDHRQAALGDLSKGISLSVFFRTNGTKIDPALSTHLYDLVKLIRDVPEIKVQLSAYADERGLPSYNLQLSQARARAVQAELIKAGLPADRIQQHAYGETRARAGSSDTEGYVFDRRVDIELTLDVEA